MINLYSIYNVFTVGIKMLSAPLVLYLISNQFNSGEVVVYFLCLTFLNMRTIFEGGVTNVIKRAYVLDLKADKNKNLSFSLIWFSFASILLFLFSSLSAVVYFSIFVESIGTYEVSLVILACFFSALRVASLPIDSYLDGLQYQMQYRVVLLFSTLISVISNVLFIYLGYSLLAIVLSQFILVASFILFSLKYLKVLHFEPYLLSTCEFKEIFNKKRVIITKTMMTWGCGFFFWNGTALVASAMDINEDYLAKILFSFVLVKSLYDISFAIIQSQFSKFSYYIGLKDFVNLRRLLIYNASTSIITYAILSFTLFLALSFFPNLVFFEKLLSGNDLISLLILFLLILMKSIIHNFVRSFQTEPFFFYVFYNALSVMFGVYLSTVMSLPIFFIQVLLMVPMLILSFNVVKSKLYEY